MTFSASLSNSGRSTSAVPSAASRGVCSILISEPGTWRAFDSKSIPRTDDVPTSRVSTRFSSKLGRRRRWCGRYDWLSGLRSQLGLQGLPVRLVGRRQAVQVGLGPALPGRLELALDFGHCDVRFCEEPIPGGLPARVVDLDRAEVAAGCAQQREATAERLDGQLSVA